MSTRSRQAQALARELSERAGVRVTIESTGRGEWLLQWTHGPTDAQMEALAADLAGRYPGMVGQHLGRSRNWAPHAWAARAVAAGREGCLAEAVAEGAAGYREPGPGSGFAAGGLTPEGLALLSYVERLLEETPEPDVASDPADVPVIERLVKAAEGSEFGMTRLLLDPRAEGFIWRGELPPGVTPLRRDRSASARREGDSRPPDSAREEIIMTDPDETASLVGQITGAYREHVAAEAAAVPGRVRGEDVEDQADALADTAARLAELLTALTREPRRSLDAIAVFRGLSRSAESMAAAAVELRRQEWFDLDDAADAETSAAWTGALEGLRSAASTFEWVADGWI